jgi:hypothetical protein
MSDLSPQCAAKQTSLSALTPSPTTSGWRPRPESGLDALALKAHQASMPEKIGLVVEQFVRRGCLTAVYRIGADSILGIGRRFWDLLPLRRDQKLFPHFGEAGTAVFAVEEVKYGGHDLTSLFDLHHQPQAIILPGGQDVN